MVTWLGVSVLFVLVAYWTIVLAGDEEKAVDDAVKYGSSNAVVQQTQDLTSLQCLAGDQLCETDRVGFEAIAQLHSQIDDDHDGSLNRAESAEFIRDDLKHDGGSETFHGNDDFISVHELWQMWIKSPVYNWSVDSVISWLSEHVELSQYVANFKANAIKGRALPRLASNYLSFLSTLGIKNPVHKQKLSIKATDVVLFGPPKSGHNFVKDIIVAVSVIIAVGGCYFAYRQHRQAQAHVQRLMKDLSSLQNAEDALSQLHQQLEQAQTAQRLVADDKQDLERQLQDIGSAKAEAERLRQQREMQHEEEFSQLKLAEEELIQVRRALCEAERQLEIRQQMPFADLQQWLQLTYEIETKYFEERRQSTEKQLIYAKDMCEKIRKQKSKFLGSFRVAHTASLDDTDSKIMSVRAALEDIKVELQERSQRWKKIEKICGFNIITNPGIPYLDSLLRKSTVVSANSLPHSRSQTKFLDAEDDDDDEIRSTIMPHTLYGSDLRERRAIDGSHSSLLSAPMSLQDGQRRSPLMSSKFTQQRHTVSGAEQRQASSGSEGSLLSLDKNSIFELGGELRTDDVMTEPVPSAVKSVNDPAQLRQAEYDQANGRSSPCPSANALHVPPGNETDIRKSPSAEHKKRSALLKLLHSSKQKPT